MTTADPRLYASSLAVGLPEAWTVSEGLTLRSPSGLLISIRLARRPAGDALAVAAAVNAAVTEEFGPIRDVQVSESGPFGPDGRTLRFEFDRDRVPVAGRVIWVTSDERLLTATSVWPADAVGAEDELAQGLAHVHVAPRPSSPPASDEPTQTLTPQIAEFDSDAWSSVITAWSATTNEPVDDWATWSPEELAVAGIVAGVPVVPTVSPQWLTTVSEEMRDGIVLGVIRSLMARRLIESDDARGAHLTGDLHEIFELIRRPALSVTVDEVSAGGQRHRWFGASAQRAVAVVDANDGSRRSSLMSPDSLVSAVLAAFTHAAIPAHHIPVGGTSPVTLEALVIGASSVTRLVRFTSAWRTGGTLRGGAFTVASDGQGSWWMADADVDAEGRFHLAAPERDLTATVLDHLPQ